MNWWPKWRGFSIPRLDTAAGGVLLLAVFEAVQKPPEVNAHFREL